MYYEGGTSEGSIAHESSLKKPLTATDDLLKLRKAPARAALCW